MIVPPLASQPDRVQALLRVTRVSLADLLGSAGGNARDQQALLDLLRTSGSTAARVVETSADGVSILELGTARVALRLAGAHAPGETLLIHLHEPTAPATRATEVKLSAFATLITDLKNSQKNQILTEATAITPMAQAGAAPEALARALQQAVRTSGLFYESHLAGWLDGRIALEDLFEEPQARIADSPALRSDEPRAAVHPQLEPLVRQQLDTFERQTIAWRGWVWPDQQAEIVISGEPQSADPNEASRTWRVHLNLATPALGTVKADIALMGRRLALRLQGEAAATPALREASADLARALCAHDLDVNAIQVADPGRAS